MAQTIQEFLASYDGNNTGAQQSSFQPLIPSTKTNNDIDMSNAGAAFERQAQKYRENQLLRREQYKAAVLADMESVKYDKAAYQALKDSGTGLAQMSDDEKSFISSRYQASDPSSRKSYTDSVADQYLSSVGLPASKELSKYRKAYYDYNVGGGIKENFSNLDDDSLRFITKHWKDDLQEGIDGKWYNSKGKEVEYKDTLLDTQLKENDLPPAEMMNDMFLKYSADKKVEDLKNEFFDEVSAVRAQTKGTTEDAFYSVLQKDKYSDLVQYLSDPVELPSKDDPKYLSTDELLNTTFNQDKYETDFQKALTANAKRSDMDHRISVDDYEKYFDRKTKEAQWNKKTQEAYDLQRKVAEVIVKPALTAEDKTVRKNLISEFVKNGASDAQTRSVIQNLADRTPYFNLVDLGVPSDIVIQSFSNPSVLLQWNDENNKSDFGKYADVYLQAQGYVNNVDGSYKGNKVAVETTRRIVSSEKYGQFSRFDGGLYADEITPAVGIGSPSVSVDGAIYAIVNGESVAEQLDRTDSDNLNLYSTISSVDSVTGKRLFEYMTDDEIGTFNYLFRTSKPTAIKYLNGLVNMLEDRNDVDRDGTFIEKLSTPGVKVSEADISAYLYEDMVYNYQGNLDQIVDGESGDWQKKAWSDYSGYSDEQLQAMYEEYSVARDEAAVTPLAVDPTAQERYDRLANVPEAIEFVLKKRAEFRESANVAASLYGYTPEAGAAATAEHDYTADRAADTNPNWREGMTPGEAVSTFIYGGTAPIAAKIRDAFTTDEQRNKYNWLRATKGWEAANSYYNAIVNGIDEYASSEIKKSIMGDAKENPVLYSLMSIPGTYVSGLTAGLTAYMNLVSGDEMSLPLATAQDFSAIWREGISEDMSPFGSFAYNTTMGIGDSSIAAALSLAGAGDAGTIMLGLSAYGTTLREGMSRGLSSEQATQAALVAGAAEYVTEKVGLETILDAAEKAGKGFAKGTVKDAVWQLVKSTLTEGSEEVASDVINFVADAVINTDMSEFQQGVDAYIRNGYTPEEARRLQWSNQITNTALSFAGGAVSGFLMSGVGGGFVYFGESSINSAINKLEQKAFGSAEEQAQRVEQMQKNAQPNPTPAVNPLDAATVKSFENGIGAVDRVFGNKASEAVKTAVGARTVSGNNVQTIADSFGNLDDTQYLYGYTHDSEGNLTLSQDEQIALATAIVALEPGATASDVDAAFVRAMASLQSTRQRANNTDINNIKTAQGLRELINNIVNTRNAVEQAVADRKNYLQKAATRKASAAAEVEARTKALGAAPESEKKAAQQSLKTANDAMQVAIDNEIELKKQAAEADTRAKQGRAEIRRMQNLINKHFASAAAFIDTYAPEAFSNTSSEDAIISDAGKKIDALYSTDAVDQEAINEAEAEQNDRLVAATEAKNQADARKASANPSALAIAMRAMQSGTAVEFAKARQSEASAEAPNSSASEQTENTPQESEQKEENGSDAVKQDESTKPETASEPAVEKKVFTISKTRRQAFDRIAKRFDCEIVWCNADTEIGGTGIPLGNRNGCYDPRTPNRIYLNTNMTADKTLVSDTVVAREFFCHEIVHYVANTKAYYALRQNALDYVRQKYGDETARNIIRGIVAKERESGRNFTVTQAIEELTANFAQEVLFSGESGDKNALTWLARNDLGRVSDLLRTVRYLIRRGNVRKTKNNAVKLILLDAEHALGTAVKERQYLNKAGLKSAFSSETIGEPSVPTTEQEQSNQAVDAGANGEYNNNAEVSEYGSAREAREAREARISDVSDAGADSRSVGNAVPSEGDRNVQKRGLDGRRDRGNDLGVLKANRSILVEKGAGNFDINETTDHKRFSDALADMRASNSEGGAVDPKTVEELNGSTTYLSADNAAGVAVEPGGNITAVFKNKQVNPSGNAGVDLIFTAIAAGGDRLDCYGRTLVNVYANAGMEPVARVAYSREYGSPEMNAYIDEMRAKGKKGFATDPDIYFMRLKPGANIETVLDDFKNGNTRVYTQEELDALPLMEYDEAKAYRDSLIEQDVQMNATGATFADYAAAGESIKDVMDIFNMEDKPARKNTPLDFSKSTITYADGRRYERLYHGGWGLGYSAEIPALADDFHSIFLTDSLNVAKSYTDTKAVDDPVEFDPRTAREDRAEKENNRLKYLEIKSKFGAKDDMDVGQMVRSQGHLLPNAASSLEKLYTEATRDKAYDSDPTYDTDEDIPDYAFDDEFDDGDSEFRLEWSQEAIDDMGDAVDYAAELLASVNVLATHHSKSDQETFMRMYNTMSDLIAKIEPYARADFEYIYTPEGMSFDPMDVVSAGVDPLTGDVLIDSVTDKPINTPEMDVYNSLKEIQLGLKDAIVDGGLFEALQETDNSGLVGYIGYDNINDGKARYFTTDEYSHYLPRHEDEVNGYYVAKAYGENTLHVEANGREWNDIDPTIMPEAVREKLAELYGWSSKYKTRDISRAARELGYDSVVIHDLVDVGGAGDKFGADGEPSDIVIVFNANQVKSIYNENPTTDDRLMFSDNMTMAELAKQYGKKHQNAYGEANNIVTAKRPNENQKFSNAVQTLKEVQSIRASVRDMIDENAINNGLGVYDPVTLDDMREQGKAYIAEHGGLTQSMRDLTLTMQNASLKNFTQYVSAANQVFVEIANGGEFNPQEYADFVAEYVMMRSQWGRAGRAMQLVNDTPLGRRAYWERVVQRINEKNREAVSRGVNPLFYRNGYQDIVIPDEFYQELAQAQTEEEINAAEYAITQYIGENSPLTVAEALRNWRYFSMLANPVTHMRNILGNAAMQGGVIAKDAIATGLENAAVRLKLMSADERTHALALVQDAETKAFIDNLYNENAEALQSGGRDGFNEQLNEAKRKSPFKWVDRLMRFNSYGFENGKFIGLEKEDALFLKMTFKKAAAQYITAQNIDVSNITPQQKGDIVAYASQQAQEATYRDASKLADALNQFARSGWVQQLIVESVMPFKKTPINIAKRGFSYSPVGLARSLVHAAQNAIATANGKQPKISASKLVDEIAQGLTGSMLAALGFFLAKAGIIRLSAGEGDKDDTFARDIGHQAYSLEIGDVSVKIESLAPLTFPLFMGAALSDATFGEGMSVSDFTDAALSIADPLMDMSFMSSLNSVLETYEQNQLKGVAVNALQSYMSQYVPTIGAKLNSTINPNRKTSKSSAKSPLGSTWDYYWRSVVSKVPVANQLFLENYVKTTGEYDTKDFGDYLLSFMNNFVSPVNVQIMDTTPVNDEISRLVAATGQSDFVPQNPKKYINIGNERYNMDAKEYTLFSKEHNELVYASLSAVISADAYKNLNDDQKVTVLQRAYDRAHKAITDKYKVIFVGSQK